MSTKARRAAEAALWAVTASGPVLYPTGLLVAARRRAARVAPPPPESWPALTVLVAAYREAAVIGAKVEDCRANGYPGPLEVVVVADDDDTARAARAAGATVIESTVRRGKSAALNAGVAACTTDLVVLTDANALLLPGSLSALVRWFADPHVGAAAGEKQVRGSGQGSYWRFESALKRAESRLGGTIGLVGELAALRRSLWTPLPEDVAVDDLWIALDVLSAGSAVVYEPGAVAVEEASSSLSEEWERRTRVVAGMVDVLLRRRDLLLRRDLVAAQLWGHRLVRATAGPSAHAALLLLALRRTPTRAGSAAFSAGHVVAAAALVAQLRGRAVPPLLGTAAQVLFLQVCGLGGTVRHLRREKLAVWPKVDRQV